MATHQNGSEYLWGVPDSDDPGPGVIAGRHALESPYPKFVSVDPTKSSSFHNGSFIMTSSYSGWPWSIVPFSVGLVTHHAIAAIAQVLPSNLSA